MIDRDTAEKRTNRQKPLAFISHDSRDKDEFVRDLATKLSSCMCPVWYDEYSLNVGDSLRESIEEGLKKTHKCILVLSPNFLGNEGWGKTEFNAVFTKEILKKERCILPVWHKVSKEQVYEYSPTLADRKGISTDVGVDEVSRQLLKVILPDS